MLKILRKKGVAKKVLWVVAIVIILSFGFFGTAYLLTGQQQITTAGAIFGKDITFPQFQKVYRDVRVQAIIRYGDQFNNYISTRNLDADTWDRLILLFEAKRRRISVKDDEVINTIQQFNFFQRDGQFDNLLYQDIVRYIFNVKARDFEEIIRDSIRLNKLFSQETFSATLVEDDIKDAFQRQFEKVQVSYVFISPDLYINEVAFNEGDAKTYYEDNKFEFSVPESINVDYIHLEFPLSISEEESEQIVEEKKKQEELAKKIGEELKVNPDFEIVAQENDVEIQSSGFFSMEEPNLSLGMSFELLKRLFELPEGEFSVPFETSNGYFIVKMAEKKKAYIPEYDEAREKVKEFVMHNAAMDIAREKANETLPKLKTEYEKILPNDFSKAAKALGLELDQTPEFKRGQYLPRIGISKDFQEASFSLNDDNKISEVIETENGFAIIHLDEYIPASDEEYEEQKDVIAQILLSDKRNELFSEFLTRLRLESNLIDNVTLLKQEQQTQ